MNKQTEKLLNEMLQDFAEDVTFIYSGYAKLFLLPPTLPSDLLLSVMRGITREFKRLHAIYPKEFKEVIFRVAVQKVAASLPRIAVVDERYALSLAVAEVAREYRPKHPTPALIALLPWQAAA